MKKVFLLVGMVVSLLAVSTAFASPDTVHKATNNPNIVAYYPTGVHAIPTDPITYVSGTDLVSMRGNSGQIEAWYTGSDGHGIHSVWNIAKGTTCPYGMVRISQAYPVWGSYLTPGADYCVKNNTF